MLKEEQIFAENFNNPFNLTVGFLKFVRSSKTTFGNGQTPTLSCARFKKVVNFPRILFR